jgi:hypothetical protein
MNTNNVTDTARLSLLLNELRLPAIKLLWPQFAEQADKEGWPAARFLTAIAEHELAERDRPVLGDVGTTILRAARQCRTSVTSRTHTFAEVVVSRFGQNDEA